MEDYTERLLKANEALLKLYDSLDPEAEDYLKKLNTAKGVHQTIVDDVTTAETKRANKEREKIDVWKIIATAVTGVLSSVASIFLFCRATEKEKDEAILSQTDKTVVQTGLRERLADRIKFW